MKSIITVDINDFSDKELLKSFNYISRAVLSKTPAQAKKSCRLKKGEKLTWNHIIHLLERYGVPVTLSFTFNENEPKRTQAMAEINYNRLRAGLAALPPPVVEDI